MKNRYLPTFIWVLMCAIVLLSNWRCAPIRLDVAHPEHQLENHPTWDEGQKYPLLDYRGVLHKYEDNVEEFILPRDNRKLTQYCSIHFDWEDIKAVYTKEADDFVWKYYVNKNPKSFK